MTDPLGYLEEAAAWPEDAYRPLRRTGGRMPRTARLGLKGIAVYFAVLAAVSARPAARFTAGARRSARIA